MPSTRPSALAAVLAAALAVAAAPAFAALKPGDPAPDFATDAALGGKPFSFRLAEALKKGPVVLYFFPKAFTTGCTIEAHEFAEATPKFEAMGATVIGVSNDDIDTLRRFSTEACRDRFAVASDRDSRVIKAYDAKLSFMPGMAARISYVIDPAGKIALAFESMSPEGHVAETLKAVQRLQASRKPTAAAR